MLTKTRIDRWKAVWFIMACMTAALLFYPAGAPYRLEERRDATSNRVELHVPPSLLSLGQVWEAARYELILPIFNNSDREVEIEKFITSCGCVNISPSQLRIPSRESREISLELNLSPKYHEDFKIRMQKIFNGGGGVVQIQCFGLPVNEGKTGQPHRMANIRSGTIRDCTQNKSDRI